MVLKDQIAYLQAGGGIVFDSVEYDEYIETINKLGANVKTIETAERMYWEMQNQGKEVPTSMKNGESVKEVPERSRGKAHIDLAAG